MYNFLSYRSTPFSTFLFLHSDTSFKKKKKLLVLTFEIYTKKNPLPPSFLVLVTVLFVVFKFLVFLLSFL